MRRRAEIVLVLLLAGVALGSAQRGLALTADRFRQQGGKLTGGTSESGAGAFGYSVAVSADGNTALIGGAVDNGGAGAAWVFTRTGDTWTQQGAKLLGDGETGGGQFGATVALSADGNTALVGGPKDNGGVGAAWVFTRSGGIWTEQGQKVTGDDETGAGGFGTSVALAADGVTALIGGFSDNGGVGAAWLFTRTGGTWSQQGGKLTGAGESGAALFGVSVALSADGNTALVGGPSDNTNAGAVWAFVRNQHRTTPLQPFFLAQGGKLTATDASPMTATDFGESVALSADGSTALIGGPSDGSNAGAAWAFTRSGATWSQQGGKLTGNGETADGGLGQSVSLSADGNTAAVGGASDNNNTGAVWVFTRAAASWAQDGGKRTASDANGHAFFGWSAAMTSDGNEFLTGGQGDSAGRGAAWVFASEPAVRTVSPGSGPTAGGTEVTIAGENLVGASAVHFGSSAARSFRAVSANEIDAVAPPGPPGAVDVTVTTSGGTSAAGAADTFTYVPPPSVTAVSPRSGPTAGGTQVTVTGADLLGATSVAFGSVSALFRVDGPNRITAVAPPRAAGTVDITVTSPNGASTPNTSDRFTFMPPRSSTVPVLSHLSESHSTWRAGNKLATASRRRSSHMAPIGTVYSFALNTAATVRLDFMQRLIGRKLKGACVAQTRRNTRQRACVRLTRAGTLAFSLVLGAHKIHFDGRLSRSKRLLPGRYTLRLTATNAAGQRSRTRSLNFRVVR